MKKQDLHAPKWARILIPSAIIALWVALGGIGGPYFGKISDVATNDQSTFLPASAESTAVTKELKKFQDSESVPAVVIFSNDKKLADGTVDRIKAATAELANLPQVVGDVSPPIVSDDGKAAFVSVNVASDAPYREFVPTLKTKLDKANLDVPYRVTGPVGFLADLGGAFSGIDGLLLGVALTVVFIILLVVYRSPILPLLVLLNSVFALAAAILAVYYLAKADVITLNGQVQGILFILVVGAATDYALLFVARYREELVRHKQVYQAIVASWKRSFEPILAAGGTVIAGLLCLLLSDLASNKALGPVGAIGILLAIVSALTLLPSLLFVIGRAVFWPRIPQYNVSSAATRSALWPRIGAFVGAHARATWVVSTVVLVIAAAGMTQLRADGVAQSDLILGTSEARDGQHLLDEHFPGGSGTPVQIIIAADATDKAVAALDKDPGVASVSARANNSGSGTLPLGAARQKIKDGIRDSLPAQAPNADMLVERIYPFREATVKTVDDEVLLEATLQDGADSDAAQATVERLRSTLHNIDDSARVGGASAVQLDTKTSAKHDRATVIPAVLIVITIILTLLLRSILAPILLLLTTLLSFAATLGIAALLFNHVWQFPGADPSVVLYGFIFLVALGIDYNIFLMTRVREESLRSGTRKGVLRGLIVTGGVITSAGIVLAATFAALAVIPILFLAQLAFIVAFGVLMDTTLVRSLLVPALVRDIGRITWWPFHKKIK